MCPVCSGNSCKSPTEGGVMLLQQSSGKKGYFMKKGQVCYRHVHVRTINSILYFIVFVT